MFYLQIPSANFAGCEVKSKKINKKTTYLYEQENFMYKFRAVCLQFAKNLQYYGDKIKKVPAIEVKLFRVGIPQ